MHLVQHGAAVTRVVDRFEAKDLGAPFKVVLRDAVKVSFDKVTGEAVSYRIPNLDGLLAVIVFARVLHPRKLAGGDIKFIRKVLGLRQKELAAKIEQSVEHLSRCETGALVMSPGAEKLLRVFALKSAMKLDRFEASAAKTRLEDALDRLFDVIKPVAAFDSQDELVLAFVRGPRRALSGSDPDEGPWAELNDAA